MQKLDRDLALRLADHIESTPHEYDIAAPESADHFFNMWHWLTARRKTCGTVGCIAGSLVRMLGKEGDVKGYIQHNVLQIASKELHVGESIAQHLFTPGIVSDAHYASVTPSQAAQALRNAVALDREGKVLNDRNIWAHFRPEGNVKC